MSIFWKGRWFCPQCERIFTRRTQVIDGAGYHSWRCGNNPLVRVDVRIYVTADEDGAA